MKDSIVPIIGMRLFAIQIQDKGHEPGGSGLLLLRPLLESGDLPVETAEGVACGRALGLRTDVVMALSLWSNTHVCTYARMHVCTHVCMHV